MLYLFFLIFKNVGCSSSSSDAYPNIYYRTIYSTGGSSFSEPPVLCYSPRRESSAIIAQRDTTQAQTI